MRFHLVALPHTNVSEEHTSCAFNQKVLKFSRMMTDFGHEVFLYSSERTTAQCTEHIVCITEEERLASLAGKHYTQASFDNRLPHWLQFNERAIAGIRARMQSKDFICLIGGTAHQPIAEAIPELMSVEFGIGYPGVFSRFKVFESYAWMHTTYGSLHGNAGADGQAFDDVIPSYFDVSQFPAAEPDDYFLYVGRLIDRKGWRIAQEVCSRLDRRLILAGPGEFTGYGTHVGEIGPELRGELMSRAAGVFVPSLYVEPFGSVHIEANLCGTPVITTDWGVFTETVRNGFNGYRCRVLADFMNAARQVERLDRAAIRAYAQANYSLEAVAEQYETYFERLLTLYGDGWYAL